MSAETEPNKSNHDTKPIDAAKATEEAGTVKSAETRLPASQPNHVAYDDESPPRALEEPPSEPRRIIPVVGTGDAVNDDEDSAPLSFDRTQEKPSDDDAET